MLPASYDGLAADPGVSNPLTAPDSIVAQYADNYFTYDSDGRVTSESVNGGTSTFTYAYAQSGNPNGFDSWATKTVETQPDGSQNIIYANYAGQTMLHVLQSGSDQWCNYYQYDTAIADMILHAMPSAVTGFDEAFADLVNGGAYLNSNAGLIQLYQYHAATGYLSAESIQQGTFGRPILLRQYQYVACTPTPSSSSSSLSSSSSPSSSSSCACVPVPVYFLAAVIQYPSDGQLSSSSSSSSGPLPQIFTTYSYTWYPGTCQVQQRITTLPVISTAQNGSGVANTRGEYYDIYGNRTWQMDERGILTRTTYDIPTDGITERIDDVDTTQVSDAPPGWTTPAGAGQHLITDMSIDSQGRTTQVLGPSHTIPLNGTATVIRRARWLVYQDATQQVWIAAGYATGVAPNYTNTLENPVSIAINDDAGRPLQLIEATRSSTIGALQPTDSFPQSSYTSWTVMQYGSDNMLAARLVYKLIPASGSGTSDTNYDQTNFGYDVTQRPNRNQTPGGTINRTVFDVRGNAQSIWVGTNDTGATDSDPTGGGAAGNNMVMVTANQYDGGSAGGDNNLTQLTQYVDSTTTRVTTFLYDWRNRRTDTQGELDFYQKGYFDNLDRLTMSERYDTSLAGNLIARTNMVLDDLSRVYQTIRYGVDPATGTVGNALVDNRWYDPAGNPIMELPAGAKLFAKRAYDSLGRPVALHSGFFLGTITYAEAGDVSADTILVQTEWTYDAASNVIQTTVRKRYNNATGTGPLGSPTSAQPLARVQYVAQYPDSLGRTVAVADYGTDGGPPLMRPDTIPGRSDSVHVTSTQFDTAGNVQMTTDAAGVVTCFQYDNRGREVQRVENCTTGGGSSSSSSSSSSCSSSSGGCPASLDTNKTTLTAYNGDGNLSQCTAVNSRTGNQVTQYVYGTTLADSGIASSLLKRFEILADSVGGSDQIAYTYNRQGEVSSTTDQMGTFHEIDYDLLGRRAQDRVTTLGSGVDGAVLRIETIYEVRGMVQAITSYDNATVGMGNIVNQVLEVYNAFGQQTAEYESHIGAVVVGTTPAVQYGYADGSTNTIRPTSIAYPNARVLSYSYGAAGSIEDAVSRIAALVDNDGVTQLAAYDYIGLANVIEVASEEPGLTYTLIGIESGEDPDTGDIYRGLDRFARVKDLIWTSSGPGSSSSSSSSGAANVVERVQHGYDRNGDRLYRAEPVDANDQHDEYYEYDALFRLRDLQRGTLNSSNSGIAALTFAQCWSLDETGNWGNFREDDIGDGLWDLIQYRAANPANEITVVTESFGPAWVTPVYNQAGNVILMPQPAAPTASCAATYDAWNRLVQLNASGSPVAAYAYDGRNRRVVKITYSGGLVNETRHFYYSDSWQVLEERLEAATTTNRQFVWGSRSLDDLVLRDRDSTGAGSLNERLYALQDSNWNVTALSDFQGNVQERYSYEAYGTPVFLTSAYRKQEASSYEWESLFAGYRWDAESGLSYVRWRYLHPGLGAWTQRDPLGLSAGVNLYEYVASSPFNFTDPSGLFLDPACLGGAAIGGGIAAIWSWFSSVKNNETTCQTICKALANLLAGAIAGCIGAYVSPATACFAGIVANLGATLGSALCDGLCTCWPSRNEILCALAYSIVTAGMTCVGIFRIQALIPMRVQRLSLRLSSSIPAEGAARNFYDALVGGVNSVGATGFGVSLSHVCGL